MNPSASHSPAVTSQLSSIDTLVSEAKAIYVANKPVLSFFARINRYSSQLEAKAYDASFRREVRSYLEKLTQILLRLDSVESASEAVREHRKGAVKTVQRLAALGDMIERDVFVFIDRHSRVSPITVS